MQYTFRLRKKTTIAFFIMLPFCLVAPKVFSQKDSSGIVEQKDMGDVVKKIFHIQSNPAKDSIKAAKKVNIAAVPAAGYSLQSRFAVLIAGVATIQDPKDSTTRASVISSQVSYTQNKQLMFRMLPTIWTKNSKYVLSGDWRIMRYPQDTYGLGGYSSLDSADHMDFNYLKIFQTILKKVSNNFYAGIGYGYDYHWNITEDGNPGGSVSDYVKYGAKKNTTSSGPVATILFDSRKNAINPKQGFFGNIIYRNNQKFLGSDENWSSFVIDARTYLQFPANSKNILAFWNYDWLTLSGNPPYLDLPSTSWDPNTNTGRGYIQGRFRSKNMLYFETEYRFGLTANGLLGAVVFGNLQSVSEWPSDKFKTIRPAGGLGLRIKLSKKSGTNADIDYGFGEGGSHGLTINIAEIF